MKKISIVIRETSAKAIKDNLKENNTLFLIKYSGLSALAMNNLRRSLRRTHSKILISRNTVVKRLFKDMKQDQLLNSIDGPIGLVFSGEDAASSSKALYNFAKENDKLKIEGGILDNEYIDRDKFKELAQLPSREVLLTKAVFTMKAPITGLVYALKDNLRKIVVLLDKVKDKKPK